MKEGLNMSWRGLTSCLHVPCVRHYFRRCFISEHHVTTVCLSHFGLKSLLPNDFQSVDGWHFEQIPPPPLKFLTLPESSTSSLVFGFDCSCVSRLCSWTSGAVIWRGRRFAVVSQRCIDQQFKHLKLSFIWWHWSVLKVFLHKVISFPFTGSTSLCVIVNIEMSNLKAKQIFQWRDKVLVYIWTLSLCVIFDIFVCFYVDLFKCCRRKITAFWSKDSLYSFVCCCFREHPDLHSTCTWNSVLLNVGLRCDCSWEKLSSSCN